LALWQASFVQEQLKRAGYPSETVVISTRGDRDLTTPLPELGDKALFTAELDEALLNGSIHLAVHSLKDLPTVLEDGLELLAVPVRHEPWDVLVARDPAVSGPEDLPQGAVVATSSLRRAAQLRSWRPDIRIADVRGNVETRVRKLQDSDWDGLVLAEAGLVRLDMQDSITARFPPEIMLPAVAQGALGVVSKQESYAGSLKSVLDQPAVHACVRAERAFLRHLEGGCQVPIGALARWVDPQTLSLDGVVASLDGTRKATLALVGPAAHPEQLGTDLAVRMGRLGVRDILDEIRRNGLTP
jgi:hydroxymethylbilane synthase